MDFEKAKEHLYHYLKRDKNGLRKALLSILLNGKSYTIPEIHTKLQEMRFSISLKGTSSLVGYAHSRLRPILTSQYFNGKLTYSINPIYISTVKALLEELYPLNDLNSTPLISKIIKLKSTSPHVKCVHIVPVGKQKEVVLESIKMYGKPIQKAYFILNKGDKEAYKSVEFLENALRSLIETEKVYIDEKDVYSTTLRILEIIINEKKKHCEVYVNLSDVTTKELCLACLLSAQISKSNAYMAISSNKIVDISLPPLKPIGDDKVKIIQTIDENGGKVESIDKLVELMGGKIDDKRVYMAWRAKINYHLKGLEKDFLVKTFKDGKHLRIQLTPWGKAYLISLSLKTRKK